MANDLDRIISEFNAVSEDVESTFGSLSEEQVNWKPSPDSWSVGQCLDHLIRSNEEFFPELDKLAAGTRKNTFWQKWSPLSGIAGAFLVTTLKKDGQRVKTNLKMTPPSDIDAGIVPGFLRHQKEVLERLQAANNAEWRKVVLTSPFVKIMTYRMDTGLQAIIEHEKRHVRQAKRVMAMDSFPQLGDKQRTAAEA